jgi:hypothetical protein
VRVADVEGEEESVAMVFESPGRSRTKTTARSEAKHRKRSVFISCILPQKSLDDHKLHIL